MNNHIRIIRPALVAFLVGFGIGISWTIRPSGISPGISLGAGYFGISIAAGIIDAVIAFLVVAIWQGIRRYVVKPTPDQTPTKSKPGLFSAITSEEDALAAIKIAWLVIVMSAISLPLHMYAGKIGVGIVDAVLGIGLAVFVLRLHSCVAAVLLLALSVVGVFATGYNRFFGGEGGANLFMALLIAWANVRLVIATFRLHSIRTSAPSVVGEIDNSVKSKTEKSNKTSLIIAGTVTGAVLLFSIYQWSQPSDYSSCILSELPGTGNDIAVIAKIKKCQQESGGKTVYQSNEYPLETEASRDCIIQYASSTTNITASRAIGVACRLKFGKLDKASTGLKPWEEKYSTGDKNAKQDWSSVGEPVKPELPNQQLPALPEGFILDSQRGTTATPEKNLKNLFPETPTPANTTQGRTQAPGCEYKPIMTDEELRRCR